MGSFTPLKDHSFSALSKKLLPWIFYALLPLALFRFYFFPLPHTPEIHHPRPISITIDNHSSSISPPPPPPPPQESRVIEQTQACDYTQGKWVHDQMGPLYNDTTCGTIKEGRNCVSHGRPDTGYLFWRWKPKNCKLPRFEPSTFLQIFRNKHLAFVGDSLARNQAESLLCMLASVSSPHLVYNHGEDDKFRRWNFPSHNVTISIYWSAFLVDGIEKVNNGPVNYNRLFMDRVDERWAKDMGDMDMVVLSIGHWFLHPAVYFEGDLVLGCHSCPGTNYTEIGFYDVFGKAFRTALKAIVEKRGVNGNGKGIGVIVATFSPSHFEGEWDKAGACPKTKPYKENQKTVEGMDAEMRRYTIEEVEKAKENAKEFAHLRIEALDVTKLALLRPDGHPGSYMYPFPFADGVKDRVQNDCVHWCLPGAIDTWNEIMLEIVKKWEGKSSRGE